MKMLFISLLPLFLAELRNTYVASQYLDARVTFVTEPQISKGRLDHYILLVIPAARNVPADVVEGIWKYAEAGGSVTMLAESSGGSAEGLLREPEGIAGRELD